MKIALVAPAEERVPPPKYGGTELVIANLAKGLIARGHEVHLFATADSQTDAILHPVFDEPIRKTLLDKGQFENINLRLAYNFVSIAHAAEMLAKEQFDIIHNHMNWRLLTLANIFPSPLLTTWHTDLTEQFMQAVAEYYKDSPFTSISDNQRQKCPDLNYIATVYNGIDVDAFEFNDSPKEYLAFLGRICADKGIKEAILATKAAGKQLVIAAKLDAMDYEYYEKEIKPLIDGQQIQYIGEVDHAGKVELLKNAQAVLGLIQWEEPFGLFMVESMACGTPVIVTKRGAVPEVVKDGVTGFIVENSTEAAVAAIERISTLDRVACRRHVEEYFSIDHMAAAYEEVYSRLITPS